MSARLGALGDQHVGPRFERLARNGEALHLANEPCAAGADLLGEGTRGAEREHHGAGLALEREVEQCRLPGEAPRDEADADARAPGLLEFAPDPFRIAVAPADQATAPAVRYRA